MKEPLDLIRQLMWDLESIAGDYEGTQQRAIYTAIDELDLLINHVAAYDEADE